ncbi:head-tail connector protein [Pseudaestuariivita rosea]|uniref:head-tail connector protein n=1 Tax=Pseudaestuariivita rosea TaxID=2763263 RepID=UPI001ABB57D7|nr:hypothetical protein [Pseudaestuariivita rosea]
MEILNADQVPSAVTVEDFRKAVHLRPDQIQEDDVIALYLRAAQDVVLRATNHAAVPMTCRFTLPATDLRRWWLPVRPVRLITGLLAAPESGAATALDLSAVQLWRGGDEPQVTLPEGLVPAETRELILEAEIGYAAPAEAPAGLLQAIILITRDWFDEGVSPESKSAPQYLMGATRMIKQIRYRRPKICERG